MAKNSSTATAPAPSPSAPAATATKSSEPVVREFLAPQPSRAPGFEIREDNGPDFFSSLIGASGRAYTPPTPRDESGKFTSTKETPEPSRKEEPSTPAVEAKKPEPEPQVEEEADEEVDSDIDPDILKLVLEKDLAKEGEDPEVEAAAAKTAAAKQEQADNESVAAAWAGIVGKQVPLGKALSSPPEFVITEDLADAMNAGDYSGLAAAINQHNQVFGAWALENAWHANAARVQGSQAAMVATTNAFDDFLKDNKQYRGREYEEVIGLTVDAIIAKNPRLSVREALEQAKPYIDEAVVKAKRIAATAKGSKAKTPAVVDQTGGSKGGGFKGGATRPRQVGNAPTKPANGPGFNYVTDPFALLMG